MLTITLQAAKEFKASNPQVQITASSSSSIAGPQAVTKGAATIGACDWYATVAQGGFSLIAFNLKKIDKISSEL